MITDDLETVEETARRAFWDTTGLAPAIVRWEEVGETAEGVMVETLKKATDDPSRSWRDTTYYLLDTGVIVPFGPIRNALTSAVQKVPDRPASFTLIGCRVRAELVSKKTPWEDARFRVQVTLPDGRTGEAQA